MTAHRIVPTRNPWRQARAGSAAAALILVASVYACAPKITGVDSHYSMPEGVRSPASSMMVWADQGVTAYVVDDLPPDEPQANDNDPDFVKT